MEGWLRAQARAVTDHIRRITPAGWPVWALPAGSAALLLTVAAAAVQVRRWRAAARTPGAASERRDAAKTNAAPEALDEFEKQLMRDFVDGASMDAGFDDVGGLAAQIADIRELVLLPLTHPHLFQHSRLAEVPTGLLLYGPPGTGKTMLAKAIAKTARASFLHVNVATLESKWFGETPKRIQALFSLARRHAPCVMFIDEIDGFLSARNDADVAHVNTMKTTFMEMWDGLRTRQTGPWVLVVGATNKPWALDPAVLRRMPRQILIGLPDAAARADILRVLMRHERAASTVSSALSDIAAATEGFSGSDLRELVRNATLIPIREACRRAMDADAAGSTHDSVRPITVADLQEAARSTRPTGAVARAYKVWQAEQHGGSAFASESRAAVPPPTSAAEASTMKALLHLSPSNLRDNSLAVCAALQATPSATPDKSAAARLPFAPLTTQSAAGTPVAGI